MNEHVFIWLTWIALMLLFSAFFSGLEITFLSANKLKIEVDKQNKLFYTHFTSLFYAHQPRFIGTLLIGNNIALVIYGLFSTRLLTTLYGAAIPQEILWLLNSIISTVIVILCGDFLPKIICKLQPNFFLRYLSIPAYPFYLIFYPITQFSFWLSRFFLRKILKVKIDINKDHLQTLDKSELMNFTHSIAVEEKEQQNIKLFKNALDFSEIKIRNCLVPRREIEAVEITDSIEDLKRKFISTGFSRILIYKENIDQIIGYVKSVDIFKGKGTIKSMMLPVIFVPTSISAQLLLTRFLKQRQSLAVVMDEYGGTAGIVTVEDIIEEIVGEIEDEHDTDDFLEKRISENEFIFSGRLEIEHLNEQYKLNIPENDQYDTLAGYILFHTASIPSINEILCIDNFKIRIIRTTASKIELVQFFVLSEVD